MSNKLPSFVYVGPPKSGSTWLYDSLSQHPEIFLSSAREIFYFDKNFERGLDWYKRFFRKMNAHQIGGDISHDYLYSEDALKRIYTAMPSARIITILRHPVDRAVSHYRYSILKRNIPAEIGIVEAIKLNPNIIECSRYSNPIENLYELFDEEQIGIFDFDDLVSNPQNFFSSICEFIGVNEATLHSTKASNTAKKPRSNFLALTGKVISEVIKRYGSLELLGKIKHGPLRDLFYKDFKYTTIDENEIEFLEELLSDEIQFYLNTKKWQSKD